MSSSSDRMRLKDKIIANIQKAIRSIHELQYYHGSESSVVLTNSDRACHKLCENLDHALLHGLHNVTYGYWRMVAEFTRKDIIKEIKKFDNITTDLGRGRAWLFIALNESLLESYLRCIVDNTKKVKKFYLKEALVLDQQRMNVLMTLTSGLDFVSFQLDYNVPYLDLSTYQSRSRSTESQKEEDKSSLQSSQCFVSHRGTSVVEPLEFTADSSRFDSDAESINSIDATVRNDRLGTASLSVDSGCPLDASWCTSLTTAVTPTDAISVSSQGSNHGSGTDQDSRIRRIDAILNVAEDGTNAAQDLEVIRVTSRGGRSKRKKKRKETVPSEAGCSQETKDSLDTTDCGNVTSDPSVNSGSDQSPTKFDLSEQVGQVENVFSPEFNEGISRKTASLSPADEECRIVNEVKTNVELVSDNHICHKDGSFADDLKHELPHQSNRNSVQETENMNYLYNKELHVEESVSKHVLLNAFQDRQESIDMDHNESEHAKPACDSVSLNTQKHNVPCHSDIDCPQTVSNPVQDDNVLPCQMFQLCEASSRDDSMGLHEDEDIYKHGGCCVEKASQSNYSDMLRFISEVPDETEIDERVSTMDVSETVEHDYGLYMDNNALLHLMLNIFTDENEQLQKMFSTREGHTEGQVKTIFVLVTNKSVYLLHQRQIDRQFITDAVIAFKEIDFVALSFGLQIINIVCTNRRKQFWITTGDEMLTKAVVKTLSSAMDACQFPVPKLTVLTDATTQKICMRKYAAFESKIESSEVHIENYSLVFWEDPRSTSGYNQAAYREGMLSLMVPDTFAAHTWKPVYVILKDSMLCVFNHKTDNKPIDFVRLGGDQCVGCRQAKDVDREHCVEVILSNGKSWHLSATNHIELCDWLQSLCQAVSEGMQCVGSAWSYQPCCAVLTHQKILMCHEDVQTSFFRTLGSANMEEVTGITIDPEIKTYCLLEFESMDAAVCSEQWVLYFTTEMERNKFTKAISTCWATHFQVDISIHFIDDVPLQKRCQETAQHLQQSLQKM